MATTESTVPPTQDIPASVDTASKPDSTNNNNSNSNNNNNNRKNNNNNNKSRRPALPLPDPIPEEPVKPYDPPSKEELQKKIDEQNVVLQECYARLTHTRQFKEERQKIRDASKPMLDAARKEFQQHNEECRALFDEHKLITSKLKELREMANRGANQVFNNNEPVGAGKDGSEALKDVKNMADLEQRIREYQDRLQTESMPILEEKKIVAKISFLTHKGRDFILEKDQLEKNAKAEFAARKASKQELEEKRKQLDSQIDQAKAKLDEKKKVLDKIKGEQHEQEKKLSDATPKVDRNEERKKIDEIKAAIAKLRDDFGEELDKWYLNKRIMVEQQKIARRKKYEAAQAEREERRKAWEAEQAQYPEPHPYQAEKDMCSGLTVYLKTLLGETIEKPALNLRGDKDSGSNPVLKANGGKTREIATPGKAFGKSVSAEEDGFSEVAFSDFVKKSSGKKKRTTRKTTSTEKTPVPTSSDDNILKPHSIDYLTAFSKLEIKAPTKISEARSALEAVEAKAAFYETAPAPSAEETEKNESSKRSDGKGKGRKGNQKNPGSSSDQVSANGGVDLMNGDANAAFPGLGSDAAGGPAKARNAGDNFPSFMDVASGVAQAPAVTAVSSVTDDMNENGDDGAAAKGGDDNDAGNGDVENDNGAGDEKEGDDEGKGADGEDAAAANTPTAQANVAEAGMAEA